MKHYHFLQFTGSVFTTLRLKQLDFILNCNKYTQALAQKTGRKYALLPGIKKYITCIESDIINIYQVANCMTLKLKVKLFVDIFSSAVFVYYMHSKNTITLSIDNMFTIKIELKINNEDKTFFKQPNIYLPSL